MSQFTNFSNIQGPYYIVQIENESVDSNDYIEYEANDENEYVSVINNTDNFNELVANIKNESNIHVENESQSSEQHLIYMKNEEHQLETLSDVQPKILFEFVTYADNKNIHVDKELQDDLHDDSMQTLRDDVLVNNKQNVECENGAQIWVLMDETVDDEISNTDETEIQAAESEVHEIVVNDISNGVLTSDWCISKKRCKAKTKLHRKGVSKKKHLSEKSNFYINLDKEKKTPKRSWVWKYFNKQNEVIYQCTICNSNLSIKGFNTNNMNRHIRAKHSNIYNIEVESKLIESNQIENDDVENDSEIVLHNLPMNSIEDDSQGCQPKLRVRSWVWWLFHQISSTVASCKLCQRKIIHGGSATGNLNRHIKLLHNEIYMRIKPEDRGGKRAKQAQDVISEIGNIDIGIEDVRTLEQNT